MDMRVLMWTCLVMTALMMCTHTLLLPMVFALLVMGIVPGTTYEIPAGLMLMVYPLLFFTAVYWLSTMQIFIGEPLRPASPATRKTVQKKTRSSQSKKPTTAVKRHRRVAV